MSELIAIRGTLHRGEPCWYIKEEQTERVVFLIGDLSHVRDGEMVYVAGQPIEDGFCGEGLTLLVAYIGTKLGGKAALESVVKRDVRITVTLSSRDFEPSFRLEGKPLSLSADGRRWIGEYNDVSINGKLDVYFASDAWAFQSFKLTATATDPTDPTKSWKDDWEEEEKKGYVVIKEELDVGAKP